MTAVESISEIPRAPGIYAMYEGTRRSSVAYVGLSSNIRNRLVQHLVRRDSSVTTGASAVSLNPDLIEEVRWWLHEDFHDSHRLEAAELVAFSVLDPVLRSKGTTSKEAAALFHTPEFKERMTVLVRGPASGRYVVPNLTRVLSRMAGLEERVARLEQVISDEKT